MFTQWPQRIGQLEQTTHKKYPDLSIEGFLSVIKKYNNHHWDLQSNYLPIKKSRLHIDILGELENFDADFQAILNRINKEALIQKTNTTTNLVYEQEESSIHKRIRKFYKKDIKLLSLT